MSPDRWQQVTDIYTAALELKAQEREVFLNEICAGDEELRREVESLLKANSEAGDFISEPVIKDIAPFLSVKNERSLIGRELGHYRILAALGAGGMGEVYLAEDTRLGRRVALKTLPRDFFDDSGILQRFKTEARAAATLNHPNIATLYSVEEVEGCHFITLEYVEGKSLAEMIPKAGLEVRVFLEWFICIADALAHSHEKGIIHRDIKPGNIMITSDGAPKILDFGLAQIDRKIASDHVSTLKMTQPGQIIGTPSYMSPEQAEGKEIDVRSDIFSLGVVMYEAITGTRPFTGDSYATIVSNLLKTEPPSVSDLKPKVPFLLARLISRCLNKSRRQRFQTMNEVRVILEEIKAAVEAGVSMDSFAKRLLPKDEKKASRILIYAALSLLILIFSVFAYYYFRSGPPPPISFENITLRKLSQTNDVAFVQITPDGKSIAYFTLDKDSTRSLWIRRIEDKSALQLISKQLRQFWGGIEISPDGSQIFYIVADEAARQGTLYRISSLGGTPRKLVEGANDVGAISADGQRILFIRRRDEKLYILSANTADGGDERLHYSITDEDNIRDPKFSADGKGIFFSRREAVDRKMRWSLVEISLEGGGSERKILETGGERIGELAVLKNGKGILINRTDEISKLQQLYYVSLSDGKQQRITNDLNSYHGIGVSDDGNTIVATQNHTTKDIWLAKEGEELRKLTTESNAYTTATFTPDGRIVYDALDNNRPSIWIMSADGSNRQQLTANESYDYEPQVSPDGRFIVFTSSRSGESKVWRMNIDGSNPTLLTNVSGATFGPVISPDSSTVWFRWHKSETQTVLAKIPLAGGEISEQQPSFGEHRWTISPDGKQVALVFYDEQSRQYKVRVRPVDAEEPAKIFNISPTFVLTWTADGKNLLYRSLEPNPEIHSLVWKHPLTDGGPVQFLSVKPDSVSYLSQTADGKQTLIIRNKIITDAVMLTKIKD
jgi:serine/threonine protein kinase